MQRTLDLNSLQIEFRERARILARIVIAHMIFLEIKLVGNLLSEFNPFIRESDFVHVH